MSTITLDQTLTLGQRLAAARNFKGLTQTELAELVGRNSISISHYESDNVKSPAFEVIVRWADVTGWPLSYFAEAVIPASSSWNTQPDQMVESDVIDLTLPFPHHLEVGDDGLVGLPFESARTVVRNAEHGLMDRAA